MKIIIKPQTINNIRYFCEVYSSGGEACRKNI